VAEKSQHIVGRALDITFGGKLAETAAAARAMQRGGVGWYPHSHFIHIDSGPVRSWTIDRQGLDRLLISGRGRKRKPSLVATRASGNGPPPSEPEGPLTVKERIALGRAYAKRQLRLRKR
jgi:hypothetical protein